MGLAYIISILYMFRTVAKGRKDQNGCHVGISLKKYPRFNGKITGNQLSVHFPSFLQAPVNIFRNQAQCGSKGHVLFLVIQFQAKL